MIKASKDLFLTANKSQVVAADNPAANFLLARKGDEISDDDAKQYGITGDADGDGKAESGEAGTKKAFVMPPATKRVKK
jgi:hypothetical protein